MKKLLLIVTIGTSLLSCAPAKYIHDDVAKPIHLSRVDTVEGNQNALFVKANEWVAKTFVSANSVIQMKDKEAGKIIAKGELIVYEEWGITTFPFYVGFTLSIDVKDGRYRTEFSDFIVRGYSSPNGFQTTNSALIDADKPYSYSQNLWDNLKGDAKKKAKDLRASLKEYMSTKTENW